MSDELISRLRIKSGILRMGEPIAFGSDADALDEAIESLAARDATIAELRAQRDHAKAAADEAIAVMKRATEAMLECSNEMAKEEARAEAAEARCAELAAGLEEIAALETEWGNATVRKMASRARALSASPNREERDA